MGLDLADTEVHGVKAATETNRPLLATTSKRATFAFNKPWLGEKKKTVMVLGVERGGTSMVAGMLRALGVNMGERVGFNHEDPRFLADDLAVLGQRIKVRNKEADVWGFKVPKLVQHLDFFESNLRNPYYVIVYRNMLSVADSWLQRGGGTVFDVVDRTLGYYTRIIEHCKKTSRPVLMLNYERAVGSDEGRNETVRALGDFLSIDVDDDMLARALGMITGDGAGYLNLPEHFFAVTATESMPERRSLDLNLQTTDLAGPDGWINFDVLKKKLVFSNPARPVLPRTFWLRIDLDIESRIDMSICPLRIYFDYIGAFFPAHCARPPVRRGVNYFFVETSGRAKAFALGPLGVPMRIRAQAEAFQAEPGDSPVAFGPIADNLARPDASVLSR